MTLAQRTVFFPVTSYVIKAGYSTILIFQDLPDKATKQ